MTPSSPRRESSKLVAIPDPGPLSPPSKCHLSSLPYTQLTSYTEAGGVWHLKGWAFNAERPITSRGCINYLLDHTLISPFLPLIHFRCILRCTQAHVVIIGNRPLPHQSHLSSLLPAQGVTQHSLDNLMPTPHICPASAPPSTHPVLTSKSSQHQPYLCQICMRVYMYVCIYTHICLVNIRICVTYVYVWWPQFPSPSNESWNDTLSEFLISKTA